MIPQIHLGLLISLTKNGLFVDMDPIKNIKRSFFAK